MIGGVQPKILLTQDEDNTLNLDQWQAEVLGAIEKDFKWKLVRERDGLIKQSEGIKWIQWTDEGFYDSDYEEPTVGRSLLMSPFNMFFTWQTTMVTEIVEQREDYIKFKTQNSNYELFKLNVDSQ